MMIIENEKVITMDKDNLIAMIAASIRAGCTYSLLAEKMMDRNDAKNMAEDFIQDAIELDKRR